MADIRTNKTKWMNGHDVGSVDKSECVLLALTDLDVSKNKENPTDVRLELESTNSHQELENFADSSCSKTYNKILSHRRPFCLCIMLVGLWIYIGFTLYLNPEKSAFVCLLTPFVTFYLLNRLTRGKLAKQLQRLRKYLIVNLTPRPIVAVWTRRLSTIGFALGILVFLVIDIWDNWSKWIPLGGLAAFICLSILTSKNPRKIDWTVVVWGIILQFLFGLIILRWKYGFIACQWLGDQVTVLLGYTDIGSKFVFGGKYTDHPVVFKVLPTVVFFNALVSILYYIGAMQAVIKTIGIFLQFFLNITPIEAFATAAHIFIGQVQSSAALKPFWNKLTDSELHSILTSGFATVAGTLIAAYVEFGIPAEHVISASFMSAPAAVAIAKITFPETEVSRIKTQKAINLPPGKEANLMEALSVGATATVKLVAFVVVNLIAFISVFGFLDGVLSYFGGLVNCPELSFQLICSYVFRPVAAAMGIPWSETGLVGILIGKKIFVNEFLAYADLGAMLTAGHISDKAAVVSTYILCGFGSVAALGINLGSLTSASPDMRAKFAELLLRAMIDGNIACFMTACVAGLLYQDVQYTDGFTTDYNSTAALNSTTVASVVTFT